MFKHAIIKFAIIAAGPFIALSHATGWSDKLTVSAVVTDADGGLRYAEVSGTTPCTADVQTLWLSSNVTADGKKSLLAAFLAAQSTGTPIKYYGDCDALGFNRITFVRVGN
jgi:hypothetical protein